MNLHVAAHAVYEMPEPVTTLLQIEVADLPLQQLLTENLCFTPHVESEEFLDIFGNRNRRLRSIGAAGDQLRCHRVRIGTTDGGDHLSRS